MKSPMVRFSVSILAHPDELIKRIIALISGVDIFKAFLMMSLSGKSLKLMATSSMFLLLIGGNGWISISKCL